MSFLEKCRVGLIWLIVFLGFNLILTLIHASGERGGWYVDGMSVKEAILDRCQNVTSFFFSYIFFPGFFPGCFLYGKKLISAKYRRKKNKFKT